MARPKFQLDGVEICSTGMSIRAYRAAPCQYLVPVTPENKKQALKDFKKLGENGGLLVSGMAKLDFLQDFPSLRYLDIRDQKRFKPDQLKDLDNLRGLQIEDPGAGIDFSWFPELETYAGGWHADHRNLDQARELRSLSLRRFNPSSQNLADLACITRLEELALVRTGITSLDGVETLEDLRYLDIAYATKLESLDAFAAPHVDLRELSIESVKKIASYKPLAAIHRLRRLRLSSCAPMADLQWTRGMDHLDFFSFVETNVEDGDLTPLLNLPRLRYAGTMDKRHYNIKFDDLNQRLQQQAD